MGSVVWEKDSKIIQEDNRITASIDMEQEGSYKVALEIKHAAKQDIGSYKIVAKNEKGETASSHVKLTEETIEEEEKKKKKDEKKKEKKEEQKQEEEKQEEQKEEVETSIKVEEKQEIVEETKEEP